jgi:tRNA pseudouridine38-40 synthase
MKTVAVLLEYDGTDFAGWQHQPHQRTVQSELTKSLQRFIPFDGFVVGSGRTDVGVHARGQVAHFCTEELPFAVENIPSIFKKRLPTDIKILDARVPIGEDFHSRFSATERMYQYVISQQDTVFNRRYSWSLEEELSLETLQSAAEIFVGILDFSTFTKFNKEVTDHRCIVSESNWSYDAQTKQFTYTIKANRFLYSMVRALVGAMVRCGQRKETIDELKYRFLQQDRSYIQKLAPPNGLHLAKVSYPTSYKLW